MKDHNVLITGASRGIGKGAAQAFAKAGYNVALTCHSSREMLEEEAAALHKQYGVTTLALQGDAGKKADCLRMAQAAQKAFGRIDTLVNNAGISIVGLFQDLSEEEWERICHTNLFSVIYMTQALLPDMIKRGHGTIVNVSSVFGIYGASCEAAYSATKGAVNALTRSLGKELAPSGIRVNAACFGAIDTQMNDNLSQDEKNALAEEIPLGRFATPAEAGDFILRTAQAPDYFTGQVLQFDGGWI